MSTINSKILSYAGQKVGKKVDKGECWDLAYHALKHANGKTPKLMGPNNDLTYTWSSQPKNYANALPGDILQYERYKIKVEAKYIVREDFADGSSKETPWNNYMNYKMGYPRHTQILKAKGINGQITIYEQNWTNAQNVLVKKVRINTQFLEPGAYTINRIQFKKIFKEDCRDPKLENIPVTVSHTGGKCKIYRPEEQVNETASLVHSPSAQMAFDLTVPKNKEIAVKNIYLV